MVGGQPPVNVRRVGEKHNTVKQADSGFGSRCSRKSRGTPEAWSRLCVLSGSFPHDLCHVWDSPCWLLALFQILKDDTVKVLHSICQQVWKTQQWPQDWKRSLFNPIPKKGNAKECSNYRTIARISHASKVMLKILQARLQQYMNRELPDVQGVLEKAEEPEIKLPTSTGSSKRQESSRKTSISALLTMPMPLLWIAINCGKFFKR